MFSPGNMGMLPTIMPKPIGISSIGSHSLRMASVMKTSPMTIIATFCHAQLAKPVYSQNWARDWKMCSIRELGNRYDRVAFLEGVSLMHENLGDGAVLGGGDLVLHLHGLEDHELLALLRSVATQT